VQIIQKLFSYVLFAAGQHDTFQPVTPLTDGAVNETLRQFAALRDDRTLELLDCSDCD